MKASIILPTRNRYKKLKRCLDSIAKNTSVSHEVIIIFDGDEVNFKKMLKIKKKNYKTTCNLQTQEYWRCINQGCFLSSGDYIIYFADDLVVKKDWLKHAIEVFEQSFKDGIGMVALRTDMNEGITHAPHAMFSRKTILLRGYIAPSCYRHYFCDTEMSLRMQRIGRYKPTEKVVLIHKKKEKDDTYNESYKKCWKSDEKNFLLRNPDLVAGLVLHRGDKKPPLLYSQWWAK